MSLRLGLDVGGTNLKAAVVSTGSAGVATVATASIPTPTTGADELLTALAALGSSLLAKHEVEGIGMTFPGVLDPATGISTVTPNLPGDWMTTSVSGRMASLLGREVVVLNDARAFTLAEALAGAAVGYGGVLAIVLGTGIGGGVLIDGRLHGGRMRRAGEFGHQTVVPDGPLCGCGNHGCLEAVARSGVIAEAAGVDTAEEAFRRAAAGEPRARVAVETAARHLAIGISNAHALLSPDVVVIGGGVASAGDALLEPVRRAVAERLSLVPASELEIVLGTLGPYAGAIGAALWARDDIRSAR